MPSQPFRIVSAENCMTRNNKDGDGGRWGVGQACNFRSILDAIASLIEAQRPDLAMVLIEQELDSET